MTNGDLQKRVDASPRLSALRDRLTNELVFRADNSVQFDPLLVLAVISLMLQIIYYCRDLRKPDEIKQDIKDIRSLPARKLIRLRRRANLLWRDCCADKQDSRHDANPILTALYELGESADDATLDELIELAKEQ